MTAEMFFEKFRTAKKVAALAAFVLFLLCISFPSYAEEAADDGTKVSFLSGLNAWDMPSLSASEKGFLKYMVNIADSGGATTVHATSDSEMSSIGYGISRRDLTVVMRDGMDVILNCLCGNAFYNQVAGGIKVNLYLEGGGGDVNAENDTRRVTRIETVVDGSGCQAIAGANDRYRATQERLAGILVSEVGISQEDTQVSALRKINNWICTGFSYDDAAFNYTVDQSLDSRRCVCGQISQIMKFSCDYLGIPCDLVADSQMAHAYNRVYLGGVPYYIDATWNNLQGNPERWFLKSASEFSVDHGIG